MRDPEGRLEDAYRTPKAIIQRILSCWRNRWKDRWGTAGAANHHRRRLWLAGVVVDGVPASGKHFTGRHPAPGDLDSWA